MKVTVGAVLSIRMVRLMTLASRLPALSVTASVSVYVPSLTSVVSHGQLQLRMPVQPVNVPLDGPAYVSTTDATSVVASALVPVIVILRREGPVGVALMVPVGAVRSDLTMVPGWMVVELSTLS